MSRSEALVRLVPVYGLPLLAIALAVIFSILLPTSFPTMFNVRSILSDKAIVALLALSAMLPMIAGRIDLTIGYGIVLWHILAISLQTVYGLPWPVSVMIVLGCGLLAGLVNGVLVEVAQIDSFIATLGTGTVLYALALWHTDGRQVVGALPPAFLKINALFVFGLPITAFYVLGLSILIWLVTERLPLGRQLYAIGASPKAAALNGIPVRTYVILSFVASGFLTAFTGVILASKLRIGQAGVGLEYLVAGACGSLPRLDDDQARTRQCVGNHRRRACVGDRHFRHSATRRPFLYRTSVQRGHPDHRDRACGICAAKQAQRESKSHERILERIAFTLHRHCEERSDEAIHR